MSEARDKLDDWLYRTRDEELLKEEEQIAEMKEKLKDLDSVTAEDILCGWYHDVIDTVDPTVCDIEGKDL